MKIFKLNETCRDNTQNLKLAVFALNRSAIAIYLALIIFIAIAWVNG